MLQDILIPLNIADREDFLSKNPHKHFNEYLHHFSEKIIDTLLKNRNMPSLKRKLPQENRDFIFGYFNDSFIFRTSLFDSLIDEFQSGETFVPNIDDTVDMLSSLTCKYGHDQKYLKYPNEVKEWVNFRFPKNGCEILNYRNISPLKNNTCVKVEALVKITADVTNLLKYGIGTNKAYGSGLILFA